MSKKNLIDMVTMDLNNKGFFSPTEEQILESVYTFNSIYNLDDNEISEALNELHAKLRVKLEMGHVVKEKGHKPWFNNRKPELDMLFWLRYRTYLISHQGFNANVVNTIDRVSDEIVDLLGDPSSEMSFNRKGLVMGEVQSGKTSNYTALICKAADAGYKVIILLTGVLENLRRQTQIRLDEGFVGMDSAGLITRKHNIYVGVGDIDKRCHALVLTSTEGDFKRTIPGMKLSSVNQPVLVVMKKNKTPLENLEQWLSQYSAENGSISAPALIIDDEADNASVNVNDPEAEPAQINKRIRALIKLFSKVTYVGYTATPFANIFIDPDTDSQMYEDDLFPKDFIYSLSSPTNYVGPSSVFNEDGTYNYMVKIIDDADECLPYNLKKYDFIATLPRSLYKAVNAFFISNAIRDLRGHEKTHRSMLVNASRLSNIQEQIAALLDARVRNIQNKIKNYAMLEPKMATAVPEIGELEKSFYEEYASCEFSWEQVQNALCKSALAIFVTSINSIKKANKFRYDDYDNGAKVIAVGGDCLSRGLTLEGLCISYFYRNSKMYDTLMQMGRWFGYRGNYSDLCRVWLTEETVAWYGHIAESTEELRKEVISMYDSGATPKDFGLKVRSHPDTLIVTARNKMKSAQNYRKTVSLSGTVVETPVIFIDPQKNSENYNALVEMLNRLAKRDINFQVSDFGNPIIKNVPKKEISSFIKQYNSHFFNTGFQTDDLSVFFNKYTGEDLEKWDISFAQGDSDEVTEIVEGQRIKQVIRVFTVNKAAQAIRISGARSRLGSALSTREGLSRKEYDRIIDDYKKNPANMQDGKLKGINQELFLKKAPGRKPLLTIYLVALNTNGSEELEKGKSCLRQANSWVVHSITRVER
jgi:hypothetical protein